MPRLIVDLESQGALSLPDVGAPKYAKDEHTSVLLIGYCVDDGPVEVCTPSDPIPEVFFIAARDPNWTVVAHNVGFDAELYEHHLVARHSWPSMPAERWRCTMAQALVAGRPGGLDKLCKSFGLPGKDPKGHRATMLRAKPRRAPQGQGEDPAGIYWHDDTPEVLAQAIVYLKKDVEDCREMHDRLPQLSELEQEVWRCGFEINRRGFCVDVELATAAKKVVEAERAAINAKLAVETGNRITSAHQVSRFKTLLLERGHQVTALGKRNVSAILAHKPAADTERVLRLRQEGGRAATSKLARLLASVDEDHRLRGSYRYHGTRTGRDSAKGYQPQNLQKSSLVDLDGAIVAIRTGDLERVHAFGPPLEVIGAASRAMIRAAPGNVLLGADYSAVESRVLAKQAGEAWKIRNYLEYDRTGDARLEPYRVTGSKVLGRPVALEDKAGREIGKRGDLSLGFGGGVGAWRRNAGDDTRSDEEIAQLVSAWRREHPAIVCYWKRLECAAHHCIRTGQPTRVDNVTFKMNDGTLRMVLPSGRAICYPEAKLVPGKFPGATQIQYMDNRKGGWSEQTAWYGTLVENLAQGASRDLMVSALVRLERAGYSIILHCHDEIVAETRKGFGSVEEFVRIMTEVPAWAEGLPLAAKGWRRTCYAEPAPAPPPEPPEPPAPIAVPVIVRPPAPADAPEAPATKTANVAPTIRTQIPLRDLIEGINAEGKTRCPFHADSRPSLHVYDDHVHCFACGAHVEAVDYLMEVGGMNREQALAMLEGRPGAHLSHRPALPPPDPDRSLRAALAIWEASKPLSDLARRYFTEVRGIDADAIPIDNAALRFHPQCPFDHGTTPCIVASLRDALTDELAGIHRIALTPDVFAGAKVQRRMLGRWPSGHISPQRSVLSSRT